MEQFNTILSIAGTAFGLIAIYMVNVFRKSAQTYVDEKAKNLATIEDTAKITSEIEGVKSRFDIASHVKKQVFEKEYEILQQVWQSTWEFQALARSLRPIMDYLPENKEERKVVFEKRYKKYTESVQGFRDAVIKNKPFMPQHIYEICLSLRELVISVQVEFEQSFEDDSRVNWKEIENCGNKLDAKLDELSNEIRNVIYS
jgi:hypothetical protein